VRIRSYIGCRPTLLQEQNILTIENPTIRIFFLNVDSPFFFFFFTIKFFGRRLSFHRAAFECSPLLNDAAGTGAATRSGLLFKTLKISRCVLFFFFFTPSRILPPPPASTVFIVALDTELLIRRVPFPVQMRFDQIQRLLAGDHFRELPVCKISAACSWVQAVHIIPELQNAMASFEKDAATLRVIAELKRLYKTKILPLEQLYRFDVFNSPHLTDAEFDSKPQVMLLGQYSVGKTTFIRYLLGQDFPGQRIGPEPTTDRFTAIIDGPDERVIPGNALAVSHDMPYRGLERFGVAFLNRFEGAQLPNQVLRNITLIDTPGVLSGEKQRVARGYDFCQVCSWFAARADLILLLFDAHKLDISDEFRNAIDSLKGNDDKIRYALCVAMWWHSPHLYVVPLYVAASSTRPTRWTASV
jgi:hypothetical protein